MVDSLDQHIEKKPTDSLEYIPYSADMPCLVSLRKVHSLTQAVVQYALDTKVQLHMTTLVVCYSESTRDGISAFLSEPT